MKNIMLIGDSIRMGYDKYVQNRLRSSANVYFPEENCRFSLYILRHFPDWHKQSGFGKDVDLVHWNAGLWDVLREFGDDIFMPLEWYGEAIERCYKRIKHLCPNAKQIFATSTRVIEELFDPEYFIRFNKDIEAYNAEAIRRLSKYDDVTVNDLYAATKNAPDSCYSDMTHFYTPEGIKLTGDCVCKAISEVLGIKPEEETEFDSSVNTAEVGH